MATVRRPGAWPPPPLAGSPEDRAMDDIGFDRLTRSLTTPGSRRRTLATAFAGVLGVLGFAAVDEASAAKSPKCKRKPGECERCDRGTCKKKDGKKRCKAGKIKAKAFGTPCSIGSCQNGACTANPPPTCPGGATGGSCPGGVGNFATCAGNESCICYSTASGGVLCAQMKLQCSAMACPNGQGDCPPDTTCVINTCCPGRPAICAPNSAICV
jgi:hypothetical protein